MAKGCSTKSCLSPLLNSFLTQEREITLVGEIDALDINAWFVHMRKTPGGEAARKEGVQIARDMLFAVRERVQGA